MATFQADQGILGQLLEAFLASQPDQKFNQNQAVQDQAAAQDLANRRKFAFGAGLNVHKDISGNVIDQLNPPPRGLAAFFANNRGRGVRRGEFDPTGAKAQARREQGFKLENRLTKSFIEGLRPPIPPAEPPPVPTESPVAPVPGGISPEIQAKAAGHAQNISNDFVNFFDSGGGGTWTTPAWNAAPTSPAVTPAPTPASPGLTFDKLRAPPTERERQFGSLQEFKPELGLPEAFQPLGRPPTDPPPFGGPGAGGFSTSEDFGGPTNFQVPSLSDVRAAPEFAQQINKDKIIELLDLVTTGAAGAGTLPGMARGLTRPWGETAQDDVDSLLDWLQRTFLTEEGPTGIELMREERRRSSPEQDALNALIEEGNRARAEIQRKKQR
jgi:hypothetical protein